MELNCCKYSLPHIIIQFLHAFRNISSFDRIWITRDAFRNISSFDQFRPDLDYVRCIRKYFEFRPISTGFGLRAMHSEIFRVLTNVDRIWITRALLIIFKPAFCEINRHCDVEPCVQTDIDL
jgi:hypothetical protein